MTQTTKIADPSKTDAQGTRSACGEHHNKNKVCTHCDQIQTGQAGCSCHAPTVCSECGV